MFHYGSGFISDLNLMDNSKVFVFLLFPVKLRNHLKLEMKASSMLLHAHHCNSVSSEYGNSLFGEYVPFCFPLSARYCRDGYVQLERSEEELFLIEYIENNFNINLDKYLNDLSNSTYKKPEDNEVIDEKNIFNFLRVSFEHADFVTTIVKKIKKSDENLLKNYHTIRDFIDANESSIIQNFITGKSLYIESLGKSQLDLIMSSDHLDGYFHDDSNRVSAPAYRLFAIIEYMMHCNRNFKVCGMGKQSNSPFFINLEKEAKAIILDRQLNEEG